MGKSNGSLKPNAVLFCDYLGMPANPLLGLQVPAIMEYKISSQVHVRGLIRKDVFYVYRKSFRIILCKWR